MAEVKDGLSMLDEHGQKMRIIPAEVTGFFRRNRVWTQFILIAIFLALPWIRVGGEQAILLDLGQRKFAIFGLVLFAHDAPNIFFLLGILVFGLAFVTAVWGRVWCGWACPQTVFIDAIYRRIEILVEGNYIARRKLDQQEMDLTKATKIGVKWSLFFAVSSLIAHSFTAYFVGSKQLSLMVLEGPSAHMATFVFVSAMTAVLLFDFGWFREQFCIVMCPYGRFQSVLLDKQSVTVLYDEKRGETRKGLADANQLQGDCVACNRCVQVCPTGIDIRKGVQLECIACTACIDACDEIMQKLKKPKGLIRYANYFGAGVKVLRPRTAIYLFLIFIFAAGLSVSLSRRQELYWTVVRAKESPYSKINTDRGQVVLNHLVLHLKNQVSQGQDVRILLKSIGGQEIEIKTQTPTVKLEGFEAKDVHIFALVPFELFKAGTEVPSLLSVISSSLVSEQKIKLLGPIYEL